MINIFLKEILIKLLQIFGLSYTIYGAIIGQINIIQSGVIIFLAIDYLDRIIS